MRPQIAIPFTALCFALSAFGARPQRATLAIFSRTPPHLAVYVAAGPSL